MSYRYATGTFGRAVTRRRQLLTYATAALAGAAAALVLSFALGWEVVPPAFAALLVVAALGTGTCSAMGNQMAGEVYFPRSDGLWIDLSGLVTVDASYMTGRPPIGMLSQGFRGGYAAATVLEVKRSERMSAGEALHCVTVLVAAPGMQSYRTRLLMHRVQGDEDRLRPGQVLLAGRFTMGEPDVALLSPRDVEELSEEDRTLSAAALAAALRADQAPRLPIRDTRTFRQINHRYNVFWAFFYERPNAVWQDIRARGDWARYMKVTGVFFGAVLGTLLLILLVIVLMLLVPAFDGGGPGAYN